MSLFKRIRKKSDDVSYQFIRHKETVVYRREFLQSSSFRGFKRIKLSYSGVPSYDQTISFFRSKGFDFNRCSVIVECVGVERDYNYVNVYVDGKMIGRVGAASNHIDDLSTRDFDKVHVMVEEVLRPDGSIMGDNVYLFVHYVD